MARGTRFHADQTGLKSFEERLHLTATKGLADNYFAQLINAMDLKNVFARSTPTVVILIADGSFCSWFLMETKLWRLDAGSGSHPPHLLWVGVWKHLNDLRHAARWRVFFFVITDF